MFLPAAAAAAGRHAIAYLRDQGHEVLNLKPLDMDGVNTLITALDVAPNFYPA